MDVRDLAAAVAESTLSPLERVRFLNLCEARSAELLAEDRDSVTLSLSSASQHLPAIFSALAASGGSVAETSLRSPNLETLFLLLTGKELRE